MNSKMAIVGKALVAGILPMLLVALAARAIGPEVLESDAAMTVIAACGYAGVALYLLAYGGKLGFEVRLRLAMSMVAIGVIAWVSAFIAGSLSAGMALLAFATLTSSPILLVGVAYLMRSVAAEQGGDKSDIRDDEIAIGFPVLLWSLMVPVAVLDIIAEGYDMAQPITWFGAAIILNSCIYLWACVRGFLMLFLGGITGLLEAFGAAATQGQSGTNAGDDDNCAVNPATGLPMVGDVDVGGYSSGDGPRS